MAQQGHSEAVLNDLRDQWWSSDYLALVVKRLALGGCVSVADVGCGHGHWGQLLLPLLDEHCRLSGIDFEEEWVAKAKERAVTLGRSERCDYQVADACQLPWQDASFELVTCQTLLMHLADPKAALREMLRVVKPGGLLLLAEPNNVAQQFAADSVNRELSPVEVGHRMILFTACSRGRDALGRGDDCIGDRLPLLVQEVESELVAVFQNEKIDCTLPPYGTHELAGLQQVISHSEQGFWLWNKADAQTLYMAGGGDAADFATHYTAFEKHTALFKTQVSEQRYVCNDGSLHYLVAVRRPS